MVETKMSRRLHEVAIGVFRPGVPRPGRKPRCRIKPRNGPEAYPRRRSPQVGTATVRVPHCRDWYNRIQSMVAVRRITRRFVFRRESTVRSILVTGGTRGIGEAIATAFQAQGEQVTVTGLEQTEIASFQQRHPQIKATMLDVANPSMIAEVVGGLGELHVLVNCAGML